MLLILYIVMFRHLLFLLENIELWSFPFEQSAIQINPLCLVLQDTLLSFDPMQRDPKKIFSYVSTKVFLTAMDAIYAKKSISYGKTLLFLSADLENVYACQLLSNLYNTGVLLEKTPKKAHLYEYLRKKCTEGSKQVVEWLNTQTHIEELHLLLAISYSEGWGCQQDKSKYASICQKYLQSSIAQTWLGRCYSLGEGITQDHGQAVYWYARASMQENAFATNYLAKCYEQGIGVEKNVAKAIELYHVAVNQGILHAQINLAANEHGTLNPAKVKELQEFLAAQGQE